MARPYIEFIQCQAIAWRTGVPHIGLIEGSRPAVASKTLSVDEDSGDESLLIRFPPQWVGRFQPGMTAAELYVLAGQLDVNGVTHASHHYAALPGRGTDHLAASEAGALALIFTGEDARRAARIGHDALNAPWQATVTPGLPPGAARKDLSADTQSGSQTWLLGTMPMRWGLRPERHPVAEEMFLLGGALVGPRGTMRPGAYFWRPPEEPHGPFGSVTGTLDLFRTVGGPLHTTYDDETEFQWNPAHNPILPPHLEPWRSPSRGDDW